MYVPQGAFERLSSPEFTDLVSLCRPSLADLLVEADHFQPSLPFEPEAGTEPIQKWSRSRPSLTAISVSEQH